ncbi:sensor histidine kinase [Agromyces neolithicus]|uniref:Histidine kinase/HSP90-like ATPase domain-containing protein n=1 Tax=Agromyces neolithicus TaxID=269420 RepID=A0ABN2M9N8_9MICO
MMTLGLPGDLARATLSHALARAGHAAAFVALGIGVLISLVVAASGYSPAGWSAAGLVVAMAALLLLVAQFPTVPLTVVYLVAGTGIVFALTTLVMNAQVFQSTNNAILALPCLALMLVGGAGTGSVIAIIWASLGYLLGEAALLVGSQLVGGAFMPSHAATAAFVIVLVVRIFDGMSRRQDTRRNTGLYDASQQSRELVIRHEYELRATARLHDTALSHLVAISAAGSGPVDERLRAGIREDLGLIIGRDWAVEVTPKPDPEASDRAGADAAKIASGPRTAGAPDAYPPLRHALVAAKNARLEVRITGDLHVLHALDATRARAVDEAVAQCLVNVARHAGVAEAEIAVGIGGGEVTVAVMDTGVGFDVLDVPLDRIGLRTSIRARIEQAGGSVRLWSTKGIGTTIVITVPEGDGRGDRDEGER